MPERLESRNAPGVLLPMPGLLGDFGDSGEDSAHFSTERPEDRTYYRTDSLARSPELHFSIQNFIETLRAEEAANQSNQSATQVARQATEFQLSNESAAFHRAIETLFSDEFAPRFLPVMPAIPEVPPPVIHPVEPGPEPDEPPPSNSEAIADPTPTGSEGSSARTPVAASPPQASVIGEPAVPVLPPVVAIEVPAVDGEDASVTPTPPVDVPVELPKTGGETASEAPAPPAEEPSSVPAAEPVVEAPTESKPPVETPAPPIVEPAELPPPMIQPVITDPDSEHNQPSPEPVEPEGEVVPEPVVEPEPAVEAPVETEPPVVPVPEAEVPAETVPTPPAQAELTIAESTPPVVEPAAVIPPVVVPLVVNTSSVLALSTPDQLSAAEVDLLLNRATQVTARNDAIIAIVDRNGRILGVHVEAGVFAAIPDMATLVFAIDGAIAKARTAAFFSNDEAALTSRTVRFISQTTITQREVEANPNSTDDTIRGPGFVAPIGLGGHFPPDVPFTPHVDLFAIEHTNRDSLVHPGVDGVKQTVTVDNDGNPLMKMGDDILLGTRFGANFAAGKEIAAPESYGLVTETLSNAQSRGIATLPGGVPLYKLDPLDGKQHLVGGIGVFFPGTDGYATFEQNFQAGVGQTTQDRLNAPLVLEAEYTAAVIAANLTTIGGIPLVTGIGFPPLPGGGRIDLAGITLESFGPHPYRLPSFLAWGQNTFAAGADNGTRMPVNKGGDLAIAGEKVPMGWLVEPTAGTNLTAQQVEDIIMRGVAEAERVRAAIRLPLGERTAMVLAVTDLDGEVLGLYRMEDATFFSIDVAVAKARNVAYYADATALQPEDQIQGVSPGAAFTNRTFRFLAEPRFPSGIDGTTPPPFSTLLTVGVNPTNAENLPGVTPLASNFTTVLGYDAFNPGTNFREDVPSTGYQNGIVFFPGSTPLYNNVTLVGGFGVSGDGVDQDDVVTFSGAGEFLPGKSSPITRADEVFFRGVRLPYQKFPRNPRA